MKVTGCSNNNLSKQSFGMLIDFHADDMSTRGVNLPNYDAVNQSMRLANWDEFVSGLHPQLAYLKYGKEVETQGFPWVFGLGKKITDTWKLVSGKLESATIRIPRNSDAHGAIAEQIVDAAREIAQRHHLREVNRNLAKIFSEAGANVIM